MAHSQYHIVPRESQDSDEESSPHEQLLRPSPAMSFRYHGSGGPWTIDVHPVVWLRILSSIFALVAFIILVINGGGEFIATDIFIMMLLILNVLQVVNHTFTHLLKVTVELRRQSRAMSLAPDSKPRISMYFDVGLSICVLISAAIGGSVKRHRGGDNDWVVGYAFAFVVAGLQLILAIPQLANKRLVLTAKLSDLKKAYTPDIKLPGTPMAVTSDVETGSARRREESTSIPAGEEMV